MLDRLGLPRPQIATKLYGAIALTLAVVYLLAAGTIQFASRTEDAVGWIHEEALQTVLLSHDLEASLERQQRLVAAAPRPPTTTPIEARRAHLPRAATREIAALLARMGYKPRAQGVRACSRPCERQGASAFQFAAHRAARAGAAPPRRNSPPRPRTCSAASPPSASSARRRPRRRSTRSRPARARSSPGCAPPPPSPDC